METQTKKNELVLAIDLRNLPEYKDARRKQEEIVENNPLVEVTDNATYEEGKKRRTALRQGRYDLQKGEKVIAAKLKEFRDFVKSETEELISITLPHENAQQSEVEKYEEAKRLEKEEKERIERERVEKHTTAIIRFREGYRTIISQSTLKNIDTIIAEVECSNRDFEEFTPDFEAVKQQLIETANSRKSVLEEQERMRLENERLAAERKRLEDERKAQEKKLKKEREDFEAEKERMAKAEADRKAKEQAEIDKQNEAKAKAEKEKADALKRLEDARVEYKTVTGQDPDQTLTADQLAKKTTEFKEAAKRQADEAHQNKFKADKEKLEKVIRSITIDFSPTVKFDNQESEDLAAEFVGEADALMTKYLKLIQTL